ncbi:MAG: hypothetical protein K8S16_15130 [Bacteroidales bacterium]|nr:hypothetical protein [Bacteroidales bacterium]
MITIITSIGNSLDSAFDLRFGRARFFCVYNESTKDIQFIENLYKNTNGSIGANAVEKMIELGAKKIISGDFGPRAKELLGKVDIQLVILPNENKTIQDIINMIKY